MGLLDDLRRRDPVALHRFLLANHMAYAESYEVSRKFGASNINPTRHILFGGIDAYLRSLGLDPCKDVQSVLEVGSSQGYLLRHLELRLFPSATILHGIDIDSYAVAAGSAYLRSLRSRVKLFAAEMETAEHVIGGQVYDVVLCCGVLMYVNESIAEKVIRDMFSRARFLVGLICLAPLETASARSVMRALDGAFIHNMDLLIRRAGGRVVSSNLIDTSISGSSSSHVIVGEPARRAGSLIAS